MTNTTFNPSDKAASLTLSGGNLIATGTTGANAGVRAIDKQITGKFYWECTCNTFASSGSAVGVSSPTAALNAGLAFASPLGTCGLNRAGSVYSDGVQVAGIAFGTIASGTVVGIAVDCDARLIWYRLGAAGNWNASATASPVTGAGGVALSIGRGIPVYPMVTSAALNDQITANFGGSAFTGTVPSGFTSGFTAGATSSTNALVTQAAVEEWYTTNAPAQVTQVAIEEWGVLPAPPLWITQIGSSAWVTNTHAPFYITQLGASVWINTTAASLPVTGIASTAALGSPSFTVAGFVTVSPTGIASSEAIGSPSLLMGFQLAVTGIASSEALGTPVITALSPSGGLMIFRGFP